MKGKIFKAYDIRGVYPEEIDENAAYKIARAYAAFLPDAKKIVVGADNRLSSPDIKEAVIKGLMDSKKEVIDIDLCTTPMFYFAVAHYNYDGGITITASHNPPKYNGLKLVRENAIPISGETGIKDIKKIALKGNFKEKGKGKRKKQKVLVDYLRYNLKKFKLSQFKNIKVVVDTANAVPGILIPELKERFPGNICHLFAKLDGNFPNHAPDPMDEENIKDLKREVKNSKAKLGIAFDGDGDRISFVDEKGNTISSDLILALISKILLKDYEGEKIMYDLRSSNVVKETIEKYGGEPVMGRVGHSFIKNRMRKEDILFSGEYSGLYYAKNQYFFEAPLFVLFSICKEIAETKKTLSKLIEPYRKYYHSEEINFEVDNKKKKIKEIKKEYNDGKISEIDGLRVDYDKWWFSIRSSNTQPLLRLIVEAENEELMKEKIDELKEKITGN